MDWQTFAAIVTAILGMLAAVFGLKYRKWKEIALRKLEKGTNVIAELIDLINEVKQAFEDESLTEEEIKKIVEEAKDLREAWDELLADC